MITFYRIDCMANTITSLYIMIISSINPNYFIANTYPAINSRMILKKHTYRKAIRIKKNLIKKFGTSRTTYSLKNNIPLNILTSTYIHITCIRILLFYTAIFIFKAKIAIYHINLILHHG